MADKIYGITDALGMQEIGSNAGIYKLTDNINVTSEGTEILLSDSINNYDYLIIATGSVTVSYNHYICMPYSSTYTKNAKTRAKWRIGTDYVQFTGVYDELHTSTQFIPYRFLVKLETISETKLKVFTNISSMDSDNAIHNVVSIRAVYGVKLY